MSFDSETRATSAQTPVRYYATRFQTQARHRIYDSAFMYGIHKREERFFFFLSLVKLTARVCRKGEMLNDPWCWTWTHCWTVEYFPEKWPPTRICMVRFSCNAGYGKTERGRSSPPWKITPFATSKMSRTDLPAVHHALLPTRVTTPWFIRVAPARGEFFFSFFK